MSGQSQLERLQQQLENARTIQEVELAKAKIAAYMEYRSEAD